MGVAYCQCQSIRSIIGLWYAVQIQNALYHFLNLLFHRFSVSYNRLLYLQGRLFVNLNISVCGRHNDNTSCLRYIYCGLLVSVEI